MRSLAENPALADAFDKTQRGETLHSPESTQFGWWCACLLRGAETHIQIARLGVVPEFEEPWEDMLRRINGVIRGIMENYVGTSLFRTWLKERVLS